MHTFPWEPPEEPRHRPSPDDSAPSATPDPAEDAEDTGIELSRVPASLRNWQVVEIDGEATVMEEGRPAWQEPAPRSPIREQIDSLVVAVLSRRRVEITPGESAVLAVEVVNNGGLAAVFEVTVEGWIDERWCGELPLRVSLQPGARQRVEIAIAIPRQSACRAGDYPLAVVVRAARYPGRVTRLAATLVVNAFAAFTVSGPDPRQVTAGWFRPAALVLVTLANLGNQAARFHLHAYDRRRTCDYLFLLDDERDRAGHAEIELAPGQSAEIPLEIRPQHPPLLRVAPLVVPFRLSVRQGDDPSLRRSVDGEIACAPLVGPWHLVGAAVLIVVALLGSGLAGLALLLALRGEPAPSANAPAAVPTLSGPLVAFVLKMDDPVPAPGGQTAAAQPQALLVQPGDVTAPGAPANQASGGEPPVVRAEQVTQPDEPLPPAAQTPLPPANVAQPQPQPAAPSGSEGRATMTYAQMFQEIALRYDLSWQVLAATAYVESGFDSLALGSKGDLGLMQIQPATWHEWAPALAVKDPFDSYSNALVGAAYLDYVRALLGGRGYLEPEWMLVAYNWGPDQLVTFLEAGGTWESLAAERRQYAQEILQIAATIPSN